MVINKCIVCGGDVIVTIKDLKKGFKRKCCSRECVLARLRGPNLKNRKSVINKCVVCSGLFVPPNSRYRKAKCCSRECFSIRLSNCKRKSYLKNCVWCGEEFICSGKRKNQKCCSRKCSSARRAQSMAIQRADPTFPAHVGRDRVVHSCRCVVCGDVFTAKRWKKHTKCCSRKCFFKLQSEYMKQRDRSFWQLSVKGTKDYHRKLRVVSRVAQEYGLGDGSFKTTKVLYNMLHGATLEEETK